MNITELHKVALNKTLELAKGIQIIDQIIHPRKECNKSKVLVTKISKEIQFLVPKKIATKSNKRELSAGHNSRENSQSPSTLNRSIFKRRLSNSIKSINSRLMQSKAGQNAMGKLMTDHNLSFNDSIEKSISRANTPNPKKLPFVSIISGKTGEAVNLPEFQDYVQSKGMNYLRKNSKNYLTEEMLIRLQQASDKISKFPEYFESKTKQLARKMPRSNTKETQKVQLASEKKSARSSKILKKPSIFQIRTQSSIPNKSNQSTNKDFAASIQSFIQIKHNENQKFLDIIDKLDLDRPKMAKEKAHLIQKDNEKFRDNIYSLRKFENFRAVVDNNRKIRQDVSFVQGDAYMKVIEELRVNKHRPSEGELEILNVWKKMVSYGWVVTQKDLEDMRMRLEERGLLDDNTEKLIERFLSML